MAQEKRFTQLPRCKCRGRSAKSSTQLSELAGVGVTSHTLSAFSASRGQQRLTLDLQPPAAFTLPLTQLARVSLARHLMPMLRRVGTSGIARQAEPSCVLRSSVPVRVSTQQRSGDPRRLVQLECVGADASQP